MNYRDKKVKNINIRCTSREKERIESKAKRLGISVGEYGRNCILAGLENRKTIEKKKVAEQVKRQENFNQFYNRLVSDSRVQISEDGLKRILEDLNLWEF